MRGLLDRQAETAAILSALDAGLPIEISGEPGIGKSALLRHLAHHPRTASFRDGVVYLRARHHPAADLLQLVFDAFCDSDEVSKPTELEIRRALHEKQALILLDDVQLPQHELEQIIDVAPRSAFAVVTRERRLWDEVRSVTLTGLPAEDALALLEREIERPLDAAERPAATQIWSALGGHPLRILQAAAMIRELGVSPAECARTMTAATIVTRLIGSIDDKARRALLAMSGLAGVPLQPQDIAAIAELTDIEPSLTVLARRGLVVAGGSRYHLADGVSDQLRRTEDLKPWVNRCVTYYAGWAERHRRDAGALLEESEALLRAQLCAAESRRSGEVLHLGRLVEGALILGARWGAWAIILERCLSAARAIGDRSAEAWALHQLGSRAVCLGVTGTARALLRQAVTLRESLKDEDGAAASRRHLEFVLAPVAVVAEEPRPRKSNWFITVLDTDALPLRDEAAPQIRTARATGGGRALPAVIFLALLAGAAYWLAPATMTLQPGVGEARADTGVATAAPIPETGSATRDASAEAPGEEPPAALPAPAPDPDAPAIRIFSQRPGSGGVRGPTKLCYAVSGASHVRLEPDIGDVNPTSALTCLRVAPLRTTTYELTAYGRSGDRVTRQLVVIVR
jgi:hypothetical protein